VSLVTTAPLSLGGMGVSHGQIAQACDNMLATDFAA